jgi:PAS domain S-box-containing protein
MMDLGRLIVTPTVSDAGGKPASPAHGLRLRILLPISLAITLLATAFIILFARAEDQNRAASIALTAELVDNLLSTQLTQDVQEIRSIMDLLIQDDRLATALEAQDRDTLLSLATPTLDIIRARDRITHFYFILPDRTMLLRVQVPDQWGDRIERLVEREAERTGQPAWANEQGPFGTLTLRVVYPWFRAGKLLGYLELGKEFEDVIGSFNEKLGVDVFLAADKKLFDRAKWERAHQQAGQKADWDEFPSVLLMSRTRAPPPPVAAYFTALGDRHVKHAFQLSWADRVAQAIVVPFNDIQGDALGEILVLRDITAGVARQDRTISAIVAGCLVVGGGLIALFYRLLGRVQATIVERTRKLSQAEATLRISEARFRDYAETASDWFWETGPDHRFTYISERAGEMGFESMRRLGRRRWDFATDRVGESERWAAHIAALDLHEPFRDFVFEVAQITGSLRSVSVSGKPLFAAGQFSGYRGSARDVTASVAAERALQEAKAHAESASLAKSAFLANMSHELRTPLNTIIGFTDMMISGVIRSAGIDRYIAYASDINRSGLHLLDIINDVLDMARIETGKIELHETAVALADSVEQVTNLLSEQIERAELSLILDIDYTVPRMRADDRAIRQILINLVSNAIKFTPPGGAITIGLRQTDDCAVRLWVGDTGIGIAREDLPKLMHPFTQIDNVYQRKHHGTGLGLMLVRSYAELHGAAITIDSELGRGTIVTMTLPAERLIPATASMADERAHLPG